MPRGKVRVKAGDVVRIEWDDAVSFPRIEADPSEIPLPRFEIWGCVGHTERGKLVLLHEREMTEPMGGARRKTIEPTGLPAGMVARVTVYRPAGEGRLR